MNLPKLPYRSYYSIICILWIAVAVFCWHYKQSRNRYNNYKIYTGVYHHTVEQKNLYIAYPNEYEDLNHYGPLFSMLIAPFALLPDVLGLLLWNIANAVILIWSISLLKIPKPKRILLLLLCTIEFANAEHTIQFNQIITACIIFSFVLLERKKEQWATLFIVSGALIKLYPIIGLTFFVFSKRKKAFVLYGIGWLILFFILPMLISSPHFITESYWQWLGSLQEKNADNIVLRKSIDWSVMGTARAIFNNSTLPNTPFIIAGLIIYGLPLIRFKQYKNYRFRLNLLASSLMFVVLFSTGSEHPTYIIAVTGAFLWMLLRPNPFSGFNIFIMILLLVLTGLGPTDAFPKSIRESYIVPLAMKAWPCILVWLKLSYDLLFSDFSQSPDEANLQQVSKSAHAVA